MTTPTPDSANTNANTNTATTHSNRPTAAESTDAFALAEQGELAFSEQIAALPDNELSGPSLLPGWSRATVIAHVACNAAGFVRAIQGVITGGDTRMYDDRAQRDAQIAALQTAPPAQLRAQSDEESRRLQDTWAGLSDEQWRLKFTSGQGKLLPVRSSVMFRAREVWVHLVDLNIGVGFGSAPAPIREAVLREVWLSWTTRGADTGLAITTTASDGAPLTLGAAEDPAVTVVSGTLAQVTAWATGRAKITATGTGTATDTDQPGPSKSDAGHPTTDQPADQPDGLPTATLDGLPIPLPASPDWI